MPSVALIDRGHVEQVWHGHRLCDVDASRLRGQLIEVEGTVAAGMAFRDGRFWIAPPRPTADEIRAEADRRLGVFPPALQRQLAAIGGDFTAGMLEYTMAVHSQASAFLAMEAAPADFRDDSHWPAIPDLSRAPVPVVAPTAVQHAVAPSSPVEVRVVLEGMGRGMTEAVASRVIDHAPIITPPPPRSEPEPLRPIDFDLSLEHARLLSELAAIADAKKHRLPASLQDQFASQIARIAVTRVRQSDVAGLSQARADVVKQIEAA